MKLNLEKKRKDEKNEFQKLVNINRSWQQKKRLINKILILGIIGGLELSACSQNRSDLRMEQEAKNKGIQTENESIQEKENKSIEEKNTLDINIDITTDKKEQKAVQEKDWYRNSIQNLHQGNSITYADGYYYFCSQYDYSLCRLKGAGEKAEVLAEQMPAEICVYHDLVYFINASDGQTLYCIGTDGKNLTKLGNFPMQNMVLIEGKIYFSDYVTSTPYLPKKYRA